MVYCTLHLPRGTDIAILVQKLQQHGIVHHQSFANISEACRAALSVATENDRIVAFGSFHTVAEAMTVCYP